MTAAKKFKRANYILILLTTVALAIKQMQVYLVCGAGSSSQQVLDRLHVVVLTGLHQWRPLIFVTHVHVRAGLEQHFFILEHEN